MYGESGFLIYMKKSKECEITSIRVIKKIKGLVYKRQYRKRHLREEILDSRLFTILMALLISVGYNKEEQTGRRIGVWVFLLHCNSKACLCYYALLVNK